MQSEAIYKGATRPAMKMGIPLVPLVVLLGSAMLIAVWGATLLSWWVALGVAVAIGPLVLAMRLTTARDDQRFRQLFLAVQLLIRDSNGRFWHARSYSPTVFRGCSDAWRG